jgi:hypothetical protein
MVGIQPSMIVMLSRFQKIAPSAGVADYSVVRHQISSNTESGTILQLKVVNYAWFLITCLLKAFSFLSLV